MAAFPLKPASCGMGNLAMFFRQWLADEPAPRSTTRHCRWNILIRKVAPREIEHCLNSQRRKRLAIAHETASVFDRAANESERRRIRPKLKRRDHVPGEVANFGRLLEVVAQLPGLSTELRKQRFDIVVLKMPGPRLAEFLTRVASVGEADDGSLTQK